MSLSARSRSLGVLHRNNVALGKHGRNRTNVWDYPGAATFSKASEEGRLNELHPTVKPVVLIADALLDCSILGASSSTRYLEAARLLMAAGSGLATSAGESRSSAFIGGLNIGAENLIAKRPKAPVKDIHFRVEGTIARQIAQEFDDDWSFTTGEEPIGTGATRRSTRISGTDARAIVAGPDQQVDQLVLVLLSAINLARRSIRIATPYFLPDEQLITALQLAVLRGVEVHIVLPGANNHRLIAWAVQTHIRPLLETGCRLWRSLPPFDHTKLMTIDGGWSLIGSANWDMRSLRLNFELTVEFYDEDLATQLAAIIDARCVQPITMEEIDKRWFVVKLRDAAARLLMPYI